MSLMDELSLNELLLLFQKKKEAEKQGDLSKLILLKQKYPELFSKQFEAEVFLLKSDVDDLMKSDHFKALRKQEEKKKLFVVNDASWKVGMLDKALDKLDVIYYNNVSDISREMVKEGVAVGIEACQMNGVQASIGDVFPYLGEIIGHLLTFSPDAKRKKMQESALIKLSQGAIFSPSLSNNTNEGPLRLTSSTMVDALRSKMMTMVEKVIKKFDKREGFYADCIFFSLLEVSEFIGTMAGHIAKLRGETKEVLVQHVANFATQD